MANPFPANFETIEGTRRLTGQVNFTDPGNQPGGGVTPPVTLTGTDPNTTPLDVKGATAQSAPFFIVEDVDGNDIFYVNGNTVVHIANVATNGDVAVFGGVAIDTLLRGQVTDGTALQVRAGPGSGNVLEIASPNGGTFYMTVTDAGEVILGSTNALRADATGIGFFSAAPAAKPTVAGAKLPGDVVLASLLTALAALGLITDSST